MELCGITLIETFHKVQISEKLNEHGVDEKMRLACHCFRKEQEVTQLSVLIEDETLKRNKSH